MSAPSHLRTPHVPLARAWNTWDASRYIEMSFKPLGIRVTPMVYAASTGKTSFIGPSSDVRLGIHAVDASHVEARICHAGTTIDWHYAKASAFDLAGGWNTVVTSEWGLRFWVVLVLSQDDGAAWHFDEMSQLAHCTIGPRSVAIACEREPLLVTGHRSIEELRLEFETHGYWYLASRACEANVLALRFNLEEAPRNRFGVAIADRLDRARDKAQALPPSSPAPMLEGPLAAIRDVMGWNAIWDATNHRPYITCSRNWDLKKFGGFGFWLNDTAINALLVSLFDAEQARENLNMILSAATPEGNLPCIVTGNDAWVDRTQSPIVSFVVWHIYRRTKDRSLLQLAYPVLARNNEWIKRKRDGNGNGILEFGSSDVGTGLYKGTKLAAKDESFMDNSPIHDEAQWNAQSRTLDCEDVGLNCLACLDSEILGLMAAELGLDASAHQAHAEELRAKIGSHFWDGRRKIFANRLWSGAFVKSLAPTSFYPLLCGAASEEQKRHLLAHLENPETFGGMPGLPSVARDDPAIDDNVYWRGRIWPILNWLVWNGLRRAGERAAADRLADIGWALFEQSWNERRLCPENYHPVTGEGLDQPDTDPFYSWSALLALVKLGETIWD